MEGTTRFTKVDKLDRKTRLASVRRAVFRLGRLVAPIAVLLLIVAALPSAAAAAECTDTWIGPAEGTWQTAENWSAGHSPTSSDVACIGAGATVSISAGTNQVAVVQGEGTLKLYEATLEVLSTNEQSSISALTITYKGILSGPATLNITSSLSWLSESTMSGTGSTVIKSSAVASVKGYQDHLVGRSFVNEGTLTLEEKGTVRESEGAVLQNEATLNANSGESPGYSPGIYDADGSSRVVNNGTIQKTAGTNNTRVNIDVENYGTINGKEGTLFFQQSEGKGLWASGSTVKGNIRLEHPTITVESVDASEINLNASASTLVAVEGQTATLGTVEGGVLSGAGTFEITGILIWGGTMSGTGVTVLRPGAKATVTSYYAALQGRTLVNEGTLSIEGSGNINETEGATLENVGTLDADSKESYGRLPGIKDGGGASRLVNRGTILKTVAGNTRLNINLENYGTINGKEGTLFFQQSEGKGLWASGSTVKGNIRLENPTITVESVDASEINLTMSASTLTVAEGQTATLGTVAGGIFTGAGTLEIVGTLNWSGTMAGSGTTIVRSGAEANVTSYYAYLKERTLVNEGTVTLESRGSIRESEGAVLENKGTLNANSVESYGYGPGIFDEGGTPRVVNYGTIQKTANESKTRVNINLENYGTIAVTAGTLFFNKEGATETLAPGSILEGTLLFQGPVVDAHNFSAPSGAISIGTLNVEGDSNSIANLTTSNLGGPGSLEVTSSLHWAGSMSGPGELVLAHGTENEINGGNSVATVSERRIVNFGTITQHGYTLVHEANGAVIENLGTYNADAYPYCRCSTKIIERTGTGSAPKFINRGLFVRTLNAEPGKGTIMVPFENGGVVRVEKGELEFPEPITIERTNETANHSKCGDPVDCATGNYSETQTDFEIGGLGVGLDLTRTYSAQVAAAASSPGTLGYGWTSSFSDHLAVEEGGARVTLTQANGGTVPFSESGEGSYAGPVWSQDKLTGGAETGYTLTRPQQTKYKFSGSGTLESVTDRNGNETTLSYDEAGRLKTVTDPAGRQIVLVYNASGQLESAEDPMGHIVKYAYEGGNLASVTMPGAESPQWSFKYDASHRMTSMTDGRSGQTTNVYDSSSRVVSQTDPAGRVLTFKYEGFHTTITNKATGAVTDEWFTSNNQPFSITRGYGTAAATTETFTYNAAGQVTSFTNGDEHTTSYGYDSEGNRTSEKNPLGDERKWTYDGTHDVISMTTPRGETTTLQRDANGNVESASRPGPEETTQTTTYVHDAHGELESVTDPLERTWSYGYDSQGDRTSETNPAGNTETFGFDEDSHLTSMVAPRGNVEGAEPSEYETAVERDAQGRPVKVTDPLGHATEYAYDANGNLSALTDPRGHTTHFTYNADNEQTKVEKPNGASVETHYDGAGEVMSQTDGNEHVTTYVRNVIEEPVEVIDPLERKTTTDFDGAGNLISATDPAERTTTYSYDKANRLNAISYSDGTTPGVEFGYDAEGNLTSMVDGTGESSFAYDELGRLTSAEDGHGDAVGYTYNLASDLTGITYPNGKSISRAFDNADRLESVTDWLGGTTTFAYDPESNLEAITFPAASGNVDEYSYDRADKMSEAKLTRGIETLASLSYGRDKAGAIEGEIREGLPGSNELSYGYDENGRLIEAGEATFEYDAADNLTKGLGSTNTYDAASQLETGTGVSYGYDKLGERVEAAPEVGPATTYEYDQAGNLHSVKRLEEGEVPAINESFGYDGTGLLASKTSGLTTSYLTWDIGSALPLLLDDGQNSYIYGPGGLPIEQISAEEEPTYLHHDQLGSTRLLTNAGGEVSATFSYGPYGALEGRTGTATTPLGFAGQYTNPETGLEYLRARFYDPATAQFMTSDPLRMLTRAPYAYAKDSPLRFRDPSGLGPCIFGFIACDESDEPCESPLTTNIFMPLCVVPEEATPTVVNASAGFGDELLSPLPGVNPGAWGRELFGITNVDTCSTAYSAGEGAGMFVGLTRDLAGGADALGRYLPRAYEEGRAASRALNEKFVHTGF